MTGWVLAQGTAVRTWSSLFPIVHAWWQQGLVVVAAYILAMFASGWLVGAAVGSRPTDPDDPPAAPGERARDAGRIIGKCENFLVITMILMNQYEGIGLVLAAKSIARMDAMKKHPSYYLGGTLVNLSWSVLVGLVARTIVSGP